MTNNDLASKLKDTKITTVGVGFGLILCALPIAFSLYHNELNGFDYQTQINSKPSFQVEKFDYGAKLQEVWNSLYQKFNL